MGPSPRPAGRRGQGASPGWLHTREANLGRGGSFQTEGGKGPPSRRARGARGVRALHPPLARSSPHRSAGDDAPSVPKEGLAVAAVSEGEPLASSPGAGAILPRRSRGGRWARGAKKEEGRGLVPLRKSYFPAQTPVVFFSGTSCPTEIYAANHGEQGTVFGPACFSRLLQPRRFVGCSPRWVVPNFASLGTKHPRALSRTGKRFRSDFLFT